MSAALEPAGEGGLRGALAAAELLSRPPAARGAEAIEQERTAAALGRVLAAAGPVELSFAHYLAGCTDLLPLAVCEEMAAAATPPSPWSTELTPSTVEREVGSGLVTGIDERPLAGDGHFQWHRARLDDGARVILRVRHPAAQQRLDGGLAALRALAPLLEGRWGLDLEELLADFASQLDRRLDVDAERRALASLAALVPGLDGWAVPGLELDPGDGAVLALPDVDGEPLLPSNDREADQGRRLYLEWLELLVRRGAVLRGFAGPWPVGVLCLLGQDSRLHALGADVVRVSEADASRLRDALLGSADADPDRLFRVLQHFSSPDRGAVGEEELRYRLRQAEPYRDRGWSRERRGRRMLELFLAQVRWLRRSRWRPRPELATFVRGLTSVGSLAERQAGERDPLRDALQDVRVVAATAELRRLLAPSEIEGRLESLLPTLEEVRSQADELFTVRLQPSGEDPPDTDPFLGRWTALVGLIALLASLTLLGMHREVPVALLAGAGLAIAGTALWVAAR